MADKNVVDRFPSKVNMAADTVPNCGMTCKSLKNKLVNARHVTKLATGEHVALDHEIDLSEYSDEEILENAAMNILIGNRSGIKGMSLKEVLAKFVPGFVWKPEKARRKSDPVGKVSNGVKKLDFTQTVEFLMANFGMSEKEAKATAIKKFKPES